MDYNKLLEKALKELPEDLQNKERFEVPKVLGHIQGNKTVINNFHAISNALGRGPEHLLKYVLRELATPGELTKSAAIIGTKVAASRINEKIQKYADEFVICKECGKPDTKIKKDGSVSYLKCQACGARQPIKSKIV